jgi:hypothetical protein
MDAGNGYREHTVDEEERYEAAHALLEELEALGVGFRLVEGEVRFRPASRVSEVDKAELRRYKAEVYELLREEEIEARRAAHLAAQPEVDPLPDEEYNEFCELPLDQGDPLLSWIPESLELAPETERYRHDSYELKHVFERAPEGSYVTDAQFRAAMWFSGHLGRRYPGKYYEDLESRYYYVRPNREGFVKKLARHAGVPEGWAREALMGDVEGNEV